MFNIFPKFGSPGDCASTDDLTGKPVTNWFYTSTPAFTVNGKTYKADELTQFIGELLTENQGLKNELEGWKIGNKNWRKLYDEKADTVDELNKEVKNLRHLKEENIQLMERVNEIDSDQNEEYRAEILALKNDYAVLKAKYTELLEKYNGFVTMGGLKYMEAKLQIVQNNYTKCAQERDEFKHQLNAANKEIEKLKEHTKNLRDQQTFLYYENEKLKKDIVDYVYEKDNKLKEAEEIIDALKNMKSQGFEDYDPKDYVDLSYEQSVKIAEINAKKEQKHPLYPIHWGGWDKAETYTIKSEEATPDLEARVKKLEQKVEELTIVKVSSDPNYEHFKKHGTWPWGNESNISTSSHNLNIKGTI